MVVCNVATCPLQKGPFCGMEFTFLNGRGMCAMYYDKYGTPKKPELVKEDVDFWLREWRSKEEERLRPDDTIEQEPPHCEKNGVSEEKIAQTGFTNFGENDENGGNEN